MGVLQDLIMRRLIKTHKTNISFFMLRNRLLVGIFSFYGGDHGFETALGQQNK